jgi:transcriptional regulator with XRE-family HTH domain
MELRIKEVLGEKGISLTALAEASGIEKSNLSAIANGKKNPTVDTLEKIANGLGVPISRLFEKPSDNDEINGIAEYKGEFYKIRTVADLKALLAIADKNLTT